MYNIIYTYDIYVFFKFADINLIVLAWHNIWNLQSDEVGATR